MTQVNATVFDDIDVDAEAAADAEAEADVAAGRVVSHEAVKAWLLSWGTSSELPPPGMGD
jgi:predicted transcriptional regulator